MTLVLDDSLTACRRAPSLGLPSRLHVLYVTGDDRSGDGLAAALANDRAVEVTFEQAVGSAAGLARLHEKAFDAVLVSHEPGRLDALEWSEALRTEGSEEPLIVLGVDNEQDMAPLCYEVGADAYVRVDTTTTRGLLWVVARALEHQHLRRENRRLSQAEQHRLRLEHREAERLLNEQRALVRDLESLSDAPAGEAPEGTSAALSVVARHATDGTLPVSPAQIEHYRELLRTYVIMGSGNLTDEMTRLSELLASGGVSARQLVQMHLAVLEDLLRGLGSRSARHVLSRADLLMLEILVHLVEDYRHRWLERSTPPRQQTLPGFDAAPSAAAA